jgi:hypothetical protein|tara:strand:- start:405 stop:671 length:267 start_codon:yes stop_codon:yes gene_type:complete
MLNVPSRFSCTICSYGGIYRLGMTILEETQAKLALAAIKLEKLHDDYKIVNPDNLYWLLRMRRALSMLREASLKLMELDSIEIPSNEN